MMVRQLLLVVLLGVTNLAAAADARYKDVQRVVAIADIHGAYDAMVATLQQAAILDDKLGWVGGDAHLVIIGDILDRGPDSRAAMELLMRLETAATGVGGHVHVLIGNHESMLLKGDMRYVSAAEYAAFASDETDAERDAWFSHFAERMGGPAEAAHAKFEKQFPRGYFAMRRAFRPDGRYGHWLLQKNTAIVIDGTAFVHGGLSPMTAQLGLQKLNHRLRKVLRQYTESLAVLIDAGIVLPTDSHYDYEAILDNYMPPLNADSAQREAVAALQRVVNDPLLSSDGPLWYRDNVRCHKVIEEFWLQEALDAIGAKRLVVGHTPTPNRQVLRRFDGRLLEIDTGMLGFYYRGSGNALVIEDASVTVVNQSGAVVSDIPTHPRRVGRRDGALSVDALEQLLRAGEVSVAAANAVTVSDGTHTVDALFSPLRSRNIYPAVAAYRIDRLLGVDQVPVTVKRKIDGKDGSLQFVAQRTMNEAQRSADGEGASASCSLADQWATMSVFDYLTNNAGRSASNLMYDTTTWNVLLTENSTAFARRDQGQPKLSHVEPDTLRAWQYGLADLTDEIIDAQLDDVLDKRRRAGLKKRRDRLLALPASAP